MTATIRARTDGLTQMGRAHLDTGASLTLITRDFAQKLRAKKIPHSSSSVTGVFSSLQTLYQMKLTLFGSPKLGCGHQSITVVAHVIDHLPPPTSLVDMSAVRGLPFLQRLPLADPGYSPGSKIDILLEMAAVTACGLRQSKFAASSNLEACKTMFGWTVGGSFHPPKAHYTPTACFVAAIPPPPPPASPMQEDTDLLIRQFWESEAPDQQELKQPNTEDAALLHFVQTHTCDPS